jgi:hypothetical protein
MTGEWQDGTAELPVQARAGLDGACRDIGLMGWYSWVGTASSTLPH